VEQKPEIQTENKGETNDPQGYAERKGNFLGKVKRGISRRVIVPVSLAIGLSGAAVGCGPGETENTSSTPAITQPGTTEESSTTIPYATTERENSTTNTTHKSTTTTKAPTTTTTKEPTTTTTEQALPDTWTAITPESDPKTIEQLQENVYGDIVSVNHFVVKDPVNPGNTIGFYIARAKVSDGEDARFIARDTGTDTSLLARPMLLEIGRFLDEEYTTNVNVTGMVDYDGRDRVLSFMLGGDFLPKEEIDTTQEAYTDRTYQLLHSILDTDHGGPLLTDEAQTILKNSSKLNIYRYSEDGEETVVSYDRSLGQGQAIEDIVAGLYMNQQ